MIAAPLEHQRRIFAFRDELVMWARAYASNGIPVLPAFRDKSGGKKPYVKWSEATTDHAQIETWWRKWPIAMIATLTGEESGLVVLDIDRKKDVDGFATLADRGWTIPPETVEIITPSGGSHFYFPFAGENVTTHAGKLGPGVDIRGKRGLVILPPSRFDLDGPDYHFAEGQERRIPGVLV